MKNITYKGSKLLLTLVLILTMVGCSSENKKIDEEVNEVLAPIVENEDGLSSGG